ncbi:hypothetical protein EOW77_0019020 [Bradyrhizobium yuanmingense]|uniref:hypothetical protein n=1 Tax=Bradyrhizobium yuanmingense TaxID=108015 RepID=UPI000FE3248E|nr:hypothetical protein [Bradyrhizobium yuanmingense]TGN86701.1 hypothetical protein EOW77_0019020 [Bradyrhizobium yuanmingense]
MLFTRQEACTLAAMEVERFKAMGRRNQLATIDMSESGWSRYSAEGVFMMAIQEALMREIGYADGLSAKAASRVVSYNREIIREILSAPSLTKSKDRWLGYAGGEPSKPDEPPGGRNVSGAFKDVVRSLERDDDGYARLFLVNGDAVLREVDARAKKQLKIDFSASARIELMEEA